MTFSKQVVNYIALLAAGGLLAAGCGGGDTSPTKPAEPTTPTPAPTVSTIEVSPTSASLEVGKTQQFTATAKASNGTTVSGVNITWSSSDTGVVTITNAGVAAAVALGTATIQASAEGVNSAPVMITVSEVTATVVVSPDMETIVKGHTLQFEAVALASDGTQISGVEFTWSSSDEMVATVHRAGLATGVSIGEVMITATADSVSGSAMLRVKSKIDIVWIGPMLYSMLDEDTLQYEAGAFSADGMDIPDLDYTWSSSDEMVATIDSTGLAVGVGVGESMITATSDGVVSDSALLQVLQRLKNRTGTISGSNNYSAGGTVNLLDLADGDIALLIDGLSITSAAPDVFLILYTSDQIDWPIAGSLPDGARSFGEVTGQSGFMAWVFTPEEDEDIETYSHVILHCRFVNRAVGVTTLGPSE